MSSPAAIQLMQGPLCSWVRTFHDEEGKDLDYCQLCDGVFLHEVMLQIDPRPPHRGVCHTNGDLNTRIRNLNILVRNVKAFFEDVLGQLIVIRLPDVIVVSREPESEVAVEELQKLLLLILGCAVQCSKKEEIIESIKQLNLETQHSIVECIQQVTDNPETVWIQQEWGELHLIPSEQQEVMYRLLVQHVKNLVKERDNLWHNVTELTLEKDGGAMSPRILQSPSCHLQLGTDKHHYGVELADCKAKSRRLRQELEDKTETLAECKEELEHVKLQLTKVKQENLALIQDARAAKTYRDELDILKERASKVDKLENEIQRYKDKMNELEFCKSRIEELREDNRILIDTKEMLEDQLDSSRKKVEIIPELENEILKLKSKINELTLERDADRDRIQELLDENAQLQMATKQSMNESVNLMAELDHLRNQASPDQGLGDSLCDQLHKDAQGKLMKLELENQRLLSVIEQLRDGSFHEHSEKILELEKENKRLSMKVEQLLEANSKETQRSVEFEQRHLEISRETTKLQEVLDMVRRSSERQQMELQREKSQLVDLVNTLRQRNEKSNDARMKDIESENKKLIEANQEMKGHISQLQFEKDQLTKLNERLQQSSEKLMEVESQKSQIEKENMDLHKAIAAFRQTCDKFEKVELDNTELQTENRRLNKTLENLQNTCLKVDKLEHDNICMTIENQKLKKTLDTLKSSSQKVVDLEQEKQELQMTTQLLKKNCEALKVDRSKYEQCEIEVMSLSTENQKLVKNLDSALKKMKEVEQENQELENENQKLQKTVETYKVSTRKLNELERENTDLEACNHKLDREKSSLEKEVTRLKQAVELKDVTIDEFGSKISTLERENKKLIKDVDNLGLSVNRVGEIEKENRELVQQATIDKKTLATLREELVNEKIKTQKLSNDLGKLTSELQKIGLNKEKLMAAEVAQDEDRYKALESMIEEALKKSLEIKEEKIQGLESRLQESANRNTELREELRSVKRNFEALKQRHEEEVRSNTSSPVRHEDIEVQKKKYIKQITDLKDQLVESERMNSSLVEENRNLKSQLGSAREQVSALHSQVTSQQYQATSLTEQNSVLQSQNARLQVEASTLQSQNTLLTSQNTNLQAQNSVLETNKEQLIRRQEEMQAAQESLVTDHEALQKLHEQLSTEYDSLLNELSSLKTARKNLKAEYKIVLEKNQVLVAQKEEVILMRQSLEEEKELLKSDSKSLSNLRAEHSRLKDDFRLLHTNNEHLKMEYKTMQAEYKALKSEYNNTQLKNMELKGELAETTDQMNSLDVEVSKLSSKCEMLSNVNMTLNEERRSLMSQVTCLLTQYHELLTQALEDKEHFHEKEKNNMDKVNQLERQKAQLEAKIIEQFMRMDNYSPKKKGFGANLVRKVRRAGSELINKVPRTKSREGEKDRKGNETVEMGDNQDSSSLGSGSIGQESPDSSSDSTPRKVPQDESKGMPSDEIVELSDAFERRCSMRRSRQSKPNSVFYAKIGPVDNQSPTKRGSVSSDDTISLQAELQSQGSSHFGDVESCASGTTVEAGSSPSKAKLVDKDELNSSKLSLGTPGTRRAVYYNDEHDNIPTRDVGSSGESPLRRSPSVGPKPVRHLDRSSIHGTSVSDVHNSVVSMQNHSLRTTTSEYVISSASSSPLVSHRAMANNTSTPRERDRGRDQYTSMVELSRSALPGRWETSHSTSNTLGHSRKTAPKQSSWGHNEGGDSTANDFAHSHSSHGGRPVSSYMLLSEANDNATGASVPDVSSNPKNPSVHQRLLNNGSLCQLSPENTSAMPHSPNSSLRVGKNNQASSATAAPRMTTTSSGPKADAGQVTAGTAKTGSSADKSGSLANGVQAAEGPASKERAVDNSIWYEYGCV